MAAIGWINLHINKTHKLIHREIQVQIREVQAYYSATRRCCSWS